MHCPQKLFPFPFPSRAHGSFDFFLSSLTLVTLLICLSVWASHVVQGWKKPPANARDRFDPESGRRREWQPTPAWRIPWMEEPGGLQFTGSQRVRHDRASNPWPIYLSVTAIPAGRKWYFIIDIKKKYLLNLLQYCFCSVFWFFGRKPYWILAPQPEIEPALPSCTGWPSPKHWTSGRSPHYSFNLHFPKD